MVDGKSHADIRVDLESAMERLFNASELFDKGLDRRAMHGKLASVIKRLEMIMEEMEVR